MTAIAIPLFPRFTALDGIGPYEVLQRIPGFDDHVHRPRARRRALRQRLPRHRGRRHVRRVPEPGRRRVPRRRRHPRPGPRRPRARLGPPGARDDDVHDVGVHRLARARRRRPARRADGDDALGGDATCSTGSARSPPARRVVEHLERRIITAAGVSSGIDMALRLVELLVDRTAAEAAQLMIEYDPQPPFDAGAVAQGRPDDVDRRGSIEYSAAAPDRPSAGPTLGRAGQTAVAQNVSPRALLASVATSTSASAP